MENKLKEILEKFVESVNNVPDSDVAIYDNVSKLMKLGDYKAALPMAEDLCKRFPFNTIFLKTLAGCYQELENYDAAILAYNVANLLQPDDNLDCLYYSGVCYYKINKKEEAKSSFEKFVLSNFENKSVKKRAQLYLNKLAKAD